MPYDPSQNPIEQPRRKDRAVSDPDWIEQHLLKSPTCALATVYEGQPFIMTNLFVYEPARRVIYLHTAQQGRARFNIEQNSRVCLMVSEMGRLLPADTALEFSVEYSGVTIFGTAAVIEDPQEAEHGLQLILDKYFPHLHPGVDYRPIQPVELARTAVYRVDIENWSGKQKAVGGEFPGSFYYGQQMGQTNPKEGTDTP